MGSDGQGQAEYARCKGAFLVSEKPIIPVVKCNPGSQFEFYAATVHIPNQWGGTSTEARYFTLDKDGRAIPYPNPQFGSAFIHMHISDPF